jgi:type I restriction enzyme S subunit
MSNDWFFEKFALIADAPGAVDRIRELVLELAVQGKLVSQQQQDESATILLERIHAGSSHTATRRGIRRKDTQANVRPPYQLPNNWTWTTLGTIADWGSGSTPSRGNPEFFGGNITWLKSGELNDNRALVGSEEHVTELAIKQGSFRKNKPGDVLFAMYGATVGKAAILAETAVTNQAVCGCTPCLGVLNTYLFFYLVSQRQKFRNASEGGAQPNFSKDKIVTFPFPLPPLAEQKRIVARVDELMGLCDELEGQQQERELRKSVLIRSSLSRFAESPTRENLGYLFHKSYDIPPSELRKSILTLAVQGLLVPHDSESVEWETRKLKDLATKIGSGSTPSGGKESYKESGVPLIRSMNIYFGGFVRQGLAFLNDEQAEKLKNVAVKADDVLLNITGASIGRVATAPRDMEGARVNQHVCIIRPTSEITPKFLELVLASPVVQNLIDAIQVGATREALTKAMIEQFEIPVPSLAEQHRIVAKVDQLMALVDELERQQAASREKASNLLDAIVHEMTSGG